PCALALFFQVVHMDVFPILYFVRVWARLLIGIAKIHMIQFMFCEPIGKFMFIDKANLKSQIAFHAHFLPQSPVYCVFYSFSLTGMTATGIGPKSRGVVFSICPLL